MYSVQCYILRIQFLLNSSHIPQHPVHCTLDLVHDTMCNLYSVTHISGATLIFVQYTINYPALHLVFSVLSSVCILQYAMCKDVLIL